MKNILCIISCLLFFSLSVYSQKLKVENGYVLVYSKDTTVDIGFDSLNIKEYKDYALLFIKKKDSVVLKNNNIDFQEFICNTKVNVLFFEPSIKFFQQKDNKLLLLDSAIKDSINQIVIVPCYLLISEELYVAEYFERYSLYNYSTFLNKEMLKIQNKKKGYVVEYIIW